MRAQGGCYCGAVRYEVDGEYRRTRRLDQNE
jgi:hypothetical protein